MVAPMPKATEKKIEDTVTRPATGVTLNWESAPDGTRRWLQEDSELESMMNKYWA